MVPREQMHVLGTAGKPPIFAAAILVSAAAGEEFEHDLLYLALHFLGDLRVSTEALAGQQGRAWVIKQKAGAI